MFSKRKKKPLISAPTNFEHRVHTGFDRKEGMEKMNVFIYN